MPTWQGLSSRPIWVGLLCLLALALLSACDSEPMPDPTATTTPDSTSTTVPVPTLSPTSTPTPTPTPTPTLTYDLEAARDELAAARALWGSRGSNDYTVEYEALLWLAKIPTRLTIRDGVITSAVYLTESKYGAPVEPRVWYGLRTIDGAFSEIESAVTFRPVFYMSAAYDPYYGFPISFGITYANEADNHFSGGFSNYQPLAPEPSGVDPHAPSQAAGSPTPSGEGRP